MPVHGSYLAWRFGTFVVPCFRAYRDHILADVLAGYATIDERAERVADEAYERMGSQPARGDWDDDMSDAAEAASERGQIYYEMMTGMRQATINLHAAGLFHLLEQQLSSLIPRVRDSTHPDEAGQAPRANIHAYADWISANLGLALRDLPQWGAVDELRLIANAVKHAEGPSEQELRQARPDLFVHPVAAEMGLSGTGRFVEPLRLPLAGEGLFVTEEVFGEYATAVYDFVSAILSHLCDNWATLYPLSS
jgi:hypothetical protein